MRMPWALVVGIAVSGAVVVAMKLHADPVMSRTRVGFGPSSVTIDEATGRVFVVNTSGVGAEGQAARQPSISVLELSSGRELGATTLVGPDPVPPVVDPRTNHLFTITSGPPGTMAVLPSTIGLATVSMLDAHTGILLHTTVIGRSLGADPTASSLYFPRPEIAVASHVGHVFALGTATYGGRHASWLVMLDSATGKVLQTSALSDVPGPLAVDELSGRLFVASGLTSILVFDTTSGKLLQREVTGMPCSAMVVDERADRVFALVKDGVQLLDGASGKLLRTIHLGTYPLTAVVDQAAGRVFILDGGAVSLLGAAATGDVTVLEARSGTPLTTVQVGAHPIALAVDERRQRVFILNHGVDLSGGDSSVSVLDAAGGTVLSTFGVPKEPVALGVAPLYDRLFVAHYTGTSAGVGLMGAVQALWAFLGHAESPASSGSDRGMVSVWRAGE